MRTTRLSNRVRRALRGGSRGVTLIEALVAMVLVAIIAVAFLGALTTAARSAALADIRTNAESLARSELEYVKSQSYEPPHWEYDVTTQGSSCITDDCPDWLSSDRKLHDEYDGYTVLVEAAPLEEDDIQKITVTVLHHSAEVFELTSYKTNTKGT